MTLRSAPLRQALAYNGTVPGPLLRVRHGQRFRARYVSDVRVPTSIHWHGMILPNAMDGAAGVTQPAVADGGEYLYDFVPSPPGTRWYHDHGFDLASARGLFGMFVVEDPDDQPFDREYVLIFHDVPVWSSVDDALRGVSRVPMRPMPMNAMAMPPMGDEIAYSAYCINGAARPAGVNLTVRAGERLRLRVLNASPTLTHALIAGGHELTVTHADGNRLALPLAVDALRLGTGERLDATLIARSSGTIALTEPNATEGLRVFSYASAGGSGGAAPAAPPTYELELGGGGFGNPRWTIDGATWPHTQKLDVIAGERVVLRFSNRSSMEHPMHLHGHRFALTESDGIRFARPLLKDVAVVGPNGGTMTWEFSADSPAGRWLLHCHNDIHMIGGMMTEVVYRR